MHIAIANAIVELVNERGGEASLRDDYSGRGMYGETTCGVVVNDLNDLMVALINDAMEGERGLIYQTTMDHEKDEGETVKMPYSLSHDQMGFGTIVY